MFNTLLKKLGIGAVNGGACHAGWIEAPGGEELISLNPATGEPIARVVAASESDYDAVVARARESFDVWRMVPPPKRGEVVRQLGEALRAAKPDLGLLVTLETGKIRAEGEGEVQEMID